MDRAMVLDNLQRVEFKAKSPRLQFRYTLDDEPCTAQVVSLIVQGLVLRDHAGKLSLGPCCPQSMSFPVRPGVRFGSRLRHLSDRNVEVRLVLAG